MLARIKVQLRLQEQSRRLQQQAAELEEANRQLEILSVTDALTGCYNRRHFMRLTEAELEKAQRSRRAVAVLMMDVDHFKQWNDRYGHLLGDAVLQKLVDCCQQNIRKGDIFARYGGEEFVILMPETNRANASQIAERLLQNIQALQIDTPQGPTGLSVSIGVIALENVQGITVDDLIGQTDQAMYAAKQAGRGRVYVQE
jgi:diguanylate cyclase (GGDEF)-like protein